MHTLAELLCEQISSALRRKTITTCSKWAEQYRVMGGKSFPGPWTFKYHPWLKGMMDSNSSFNVGQKSAQMGFTEAVLNRAFYKIDVESVDVLYVLPSKTPDASDFSAARFDSALELSSHLSRMFSDVKNVGHKRSGSVNFYIRGAKSRAGLKSIPVGYIVVDEVDEMDKDVIPLVMERQSGQIEKEAWLISTPTIENKGINSLYQLSTQDHFFFICPFCSRLTELIFPDSLEILGDSLIDPRINSSYLKCKECKNPLDHKTKSSWLSTGRWISSYTDRESRGFYVNQLYSSTVSPVELVKAHFKGISNQADEQEFYNSKLGLPHTPDGARITDIMIDACTGGYESGPKKSNKVITMGVDVGTWLHYWIDEWSIPNNIISDLNIESTPRTLCQSKCLHFEELDLLMHEYKIHYCVIDAHPERRKALDFAFRFRGYVKMCFYGRGVQGKQITVNKDGEPTITVDRTSWLDLSLGRFKAGMIKIPLNTPQECKDHLKAIVRIWERDHNNNPVGKYVTEDHKNDHFAHARNYSELALPFATGINVSEDIKENVI